MNQDFSIIGLLLNASVVVKLVLLVLLSSSVLSWTIILAKRGLLAKTRNSSEDFEERFWSGGTLTDLYDKLHANGEETTGLSSIFEAGYEEFARQQQGADHLSADDALASVQRQMRVSQAREVEKLEGGLPVLAIIGSTAVYVGLFGTVWGIMEAFIAIGNVKQASLAMVAPGIAEALISTAIGLFAAIPAVVAYNLFASRLDHLEGRFGTFAEELAGIIERGLHGVGGGRA
ncbi:MAG: protein TolQ [Nevskiaceae bacterium]|nr:MAG: protein TolQ [Nevskiaceae bacterium]TBR74078.1 MAG: protein TolQ [Nevskiaceae bacterium]